MPAENLENLFPNLKQTGYAITSPAEVNYNCIAWAVGDQGQWWEPLRGFYWPPGVAQDYTLAAYIRVFSIHGYAPCDSAEPELEFEKVTLFVDESGLPSHAADNWKTHTGPASSASWKTSNTPAYMRLKGQLNGTVAQVMKRRRSGG